MPLVLSLSEGLGRTPDSSGKARSCGLPTFVLWMSNISLCDLFGRPEREGKSLGTDVTDVPRDRDRARSWFVTNLRSDDRKYAVYFKRDRAPSSCVARLTLDGSAVDLVSDIDTRQGNVELIDYRKYHRGSRLGRTSDAIVYAAAAARTKCRNRKHAQHISETACGISSAFIYF